MSKPSSRSLTDLTPAMREKAQAFFDAAKRNGLDLLVTCTFRSLEEQARLYGQGRNLADVAFEIARCPLFGFGKIEQMDFAPRIKARRLTNALPGLSWHNYGEAMDCVPMKSSKPVWDCRDELWQVYGDCAHEVGLFWAGDWKRFRFLEFPHMQLRAKSNPLKVYTPAEALAALKEIGAIE